MLYIWGGIVVTSDEDTDKIARIMCHWLPATYAHDMLAEIWDEVGQFTDNKSLSESIQLLIVKIDEADDIVYPEGFE